MPKMPRVRHESRGIAVEQIDHYGGSYGPFPPTDILGKYYAKACKSHYILWRKLTSLKSNSDSRPERPPFYLSDD